jgi:tetratricopeptide (TPR) repeat protein
MKSRNAMLSAVAALWLQVNLLQAQIVVPDQSPFSTVTQKVGFSEIRIEYSRPSVRGRIIFGDLVPYGKVWRTGANAATKLYINEEITIQDNFKLFPGVYSLYTIPDKNEWTIIINKDPWLWGAFDYKANFDAIRFNVKPQPLKEQVETFTIQFANVCSNCSEIQMMWDFTKVSFRISTNAEEKVLGQIKTFTSNPEAKLAGEYYLASKYYLDTNRDLNQALEWANKALQYGPEAYWVIHTKAEILAKMGDYKAAIDAAQLSLDKAKAKSDDDYVRMNEREIAKWKDLKKQGLR